MHEPSTFVGLDVHKKDIVVAMLAPESPTPLEWRVAHEPTAVQRLARTATGEDDAARDNPRYRCANGTAVPHSRP